MSTGRWAVNATGPRPSPSGAVTHRQHHMECIGSVAELEARSAPQARGSGPAPPYVDAGDLEAPDGGTMHRIKERRTSGSTRFLCRGTVALPLREQREWDRRNRPTPSGASHRPDARLVLHAARREYAALRPVGLQNVICLGHILAEDGSKMSKSKGNVVNPGSFQHSTALTPRLVHVHRQPAQQQPPLSPSTWWARRCDAS